MHSHIQQQTHKHPCSLSPHTHKHTHTHTHSRRAEENGGGDGGKDEEKNHRGSAGLRGLSCCEGAACSSQWVATVSLFYLGLFIIAQSLIGGSHLRVLGICWLQVIIETAEMRRGQRCARGTAADKRVPLTLDRLIGAAAWLWWLDNRMKPRWHRAGHKSWAVKVILKNEKKNNWKERRKRLLHTY